VSAPNVSPVRYDPNPVFNPTEDWESEANHGAFSISGNASMEPERSAYDEIADFHDQLEEKTVHSQQVHSQQVQSVDLTG
jgi:hypothetical protein